ncbi:radical SAM/SPASM domain-containing protein [Helicobacter sp. WB40]|uniref:radical SAM/SPASM domain-containing protein n=1 Tax=Helicobacter sp. WB40 TaxID=3004130 RepID=UPI0022EBEC08|nr:SPASM domain-containing protein [Helicobacter sp. WB40]MDA3967410.1 SPASM domain-containing protein [Helicobacter sp. WB40]
MFKLVDIDDLYKYKIEYGYKNGFFSKEIRNSMHKIGKNTTKEHYYEIRKLYNLSSNWNVIGNVFPNKYPNLIYIGLINNCNASCNHCPWFSNIHAKDNVTNYFTHTTKIDDLKVYEIIDFAIKSKSKLVFSGPGEPLLDERIFDFIKYAKDGGVKYISVPTNGILLDLATLKKLINLGVNEVSMGIYFSNGNYKDEKALDNMKFQICKNLQFLKDNNFDIKCKLFVLYEIEFYKEALDFMLEISKFRDDFCVDLYNPNDKYWEQNGFNAIPNKRHSCGFISSSLYVLPDGSVTKCEFQRGMLASRDVKLLSFGNIYSQTIENIWNSSLHRDICTRHKIGDNKEGMLDVCKICKSSWWNEVY